jgi:tetratricopeptide (TPR) repeat protein
LRSATDACDFPLAHRQIATIRQASGEILASRVPGDVSLRTAVERHAAVAQMQLVNISLHQMRLDVSIEQAEDLLGALPAMSRGEEEEWWRIEAETRNRLGIALSWDRQHERAQAELTRALQLAIEHRDEPLTMFWTIDLATALLHINRQSGLEMLENVVTTAHARDPRIGSVWEDVLFLAETHLGAGQLADIDFEARDAKSRLAELLDRMERVSVGSHRNGWSYISGAAALVAGACSAVLQQWPQAARWWMKAVDIGMRDEHDEFLWKSHVNLAQLLTDSPNPNAGAAELHAQEAERLIRVDLERRGSDDARRRSFYAGPLLQIHRVWQELDAERAERLSSDFPEILREWREAAPLHVLAAPSVFFVMN